jgi:hypothetical protein
VFFKSSGKQFTISSNVHNKTHWTLFFIYTVTQIQIMISSSLFKVFSYSIVCGFGYVGIYIIQQFCNVGCFEYFFFPFA